MTFRNLSARISADASSYVSATGRAKRAASSFGSEATSLAAKLQVLQGRADEAGEEISGAGRDAAGAATSFTALSFSTDGLALSFGTLSTAMVTSLIPALAVLSTVLVPLAATFGVVAAAAAGLAAAFGTVIGTGLIAFGEKRGQQNAERLAQLRTRIAELETLKQQTDGLTAAQQQELKTLEEQASKLEEQTGIMGGLQSAIAEVVAEIKPMLVAFGQEFIPLIEDAFDAIPQLVENILGAIGGLDAFKNALRDAGETAMTAIPDMIATLFELAEDALPALRDMAVWLLENGPEIFEGMVETAKDVGPILVDIGRAVARAMPHLNRIGMFVLNTLVPAISTVVGWVTDLADLFNSMPGWLKTGLIGALAAAFAAVAGPIGTVVGLFIAAKSALDLLSPVLQSINQFLWDVINALDDIGGAVKEATVNILGGALDVVTGIWDTVTDLGGGVWEATVNILGGALDIVGDILGGLKDIASQTWDTVVEITQQLVSSGDLGAITEPMEKALEERSGQEFDSFTEAIQAEISGEIDVLDQVGPNARFQSREALMQAIQAGEWNPEAAFRRAQNQSSGQTDVNVSVGVDQDGNWEARVEEIADARDRSERRRSSRTADSMHQNPGVSK